MLLLIWLLLVIFRQIWLGISIAGNADCIASSGSNGQSTCLPQVCRVASTLGPTFSGSQAASLVDFVCVCVCVCQTEDCGYSNDSTIHKLGTRLAFASISIRRPSLFRHSSLGSVDTSVN